jgi:hypothetical protein
MPRTIDALAGKVHDEPLLALLTQPRDPSKGRQVRQVARPERLQHDAAHAAPVQVAVGRAGVAPGDDGHPGDGHDSEY